MTLTRGYYNGKNNLPETLNVLKVFILSRDWYTAALFRGGATVLKVGGDNFASGASEKIFLTPPPYDYLGVQK